MSSFARLFRWLHEILIAYLAGALVCASLWAAQRPLQSKMHNFQNSPLVIKQSTVELIETFATPTQAGRSDPRVHGSRIRYANRAGLMPTSYELKGEVMCRNKSRQTIDAFEISIVAMDAFHRPLRARHQRGVYAVEQVMERIPRGTSKRIPWKLTAASGDVFEVAVIITRVRFEDGSVWLAPNEELIDIF